MSMPNNDNHNISIITESQFHIDINDNFTDTPNSYIPIQCIDLLDVTTINKIQNNLIKFNKNIRFDNPENLLTHLGLIKNINNQNYLEKIAVLIFGTKELIMKYFPYFQFKVNIDDPQSNPDNKEFKMVENVFNLIIEFNKIYKMLTLNQDDFKPNPEFMNRLKQHQKLFQNCIFSMFYKYDFYKYCHTIITFTTYNITFNFPQQDFQTPKYHAYYDAPFNCFKNILLKMNTFQSYLNIFDYNTDSVEYQSDKNYYENLLCIHRNCITINRPNYFYQKLDYRSLVNHLLKPLINFTIESFITDAIKPISLLNVSLFNAFPELMNTYLKLENDPQNNAMLQLHKLMSLKELQNKMTIFNLHIKDIIFLNQVIYNFPNPIILKNSKSPRNSSSFKITTSKTINKPHFNKFQITEPSITNQKQIKIPLKLKNKIKHLAKRETNPEKISSIILDLCKFQPMTIAEIAQSIQRNSRYISTYISTLKSQKKLLLYYPDNKNHPNQKYIANI